MIRKPDWAEKMVVQAKLREEPLVDIVDKMAADLLRRLDASWRRDVRALKRRKSHPRQDAIWEHGYLKALDDLLARRKMKETP